MKTCLRIDFIQPRTDNGPLETGYYRQHARRPVFDSGGPTSTIVHPRLLHILHIRVVSDMSDLAQNLPTRGCFLLT
ncbi:hypothetical protein SERLA73DRAFT_181490 [Serpula lacrymans var. lacrymans S7.3]|uniref:Uncharacterized protein n=2 Tax=Serpula lacrymans var. lacrymans TaxID=341189 RepID=F8PY63_SERL3|nr:uncharacterized protein SERLADRAFT_467656 [Serpula lacrymans var. lacrymans S7.9]EGN98826.1 hypothetical protein SERLA73DRAFT_181490 [Serpula lacrymans var. lacrymans S7.3]EGO24417.1 hypothetical protein SERLADRAFT_467656 [Serpula lacrymans var. lacrymans S7.9]